MNTTMSLQCIESHTEGMPARIVVGGMPRIEGSTMEERRQVLSTKFNHVRSLLMEEPRGHASMSGAILQAPTRPDADWGILFIEVTGCLPMCGHATMAVATVLVETGMVQVREPLTVIRLDTPGGLVVASVRVSSGRAESVTLQNVDSFVLALDRAVEVPTLGRVRYDMAYGGNFYAIVNLAELQRRVPYGPEHVGELVDVGMMIMAAIEQQEPPTHPENTAISGCRHVQLVAAGSTAAHSRHATVIAPGWIDRSPCGTGTSARVAQLSRRGLLDVGDMLKNESIIGTYFEGSVLETTSVAGLSAIRPLVTGRAYITGQSQWFLDPRDPFQTGFLLGRPTAQP